MLDCATPSNFSACSPSASRAVRYTPSGSVRTISSNTCTISGRERCSFSMISMRAMNFCFALSRLLISSICLSSVLISHAQLVVALLLALDHRAEHQVGGEGGRRPRRAPRRRAPPGTPACAPCAGSSRQGSRFMRGMSVETPQGEATGGQERRGVALHGLRLGARGQLHLAERVALLGRDARRGWRSLRRRRECWRSRRTPGSSPAARGPEPEAR